MSIDRTLQLRVQEVISSSPVPIAARDALKQVLMERYPSIEEMAEAAATIGLSSISGIAKATYNLPETGQNSLFDAPGVIAIRTPQGPLLVPRGQASGGQVRQWAEEGLQHHSTQRLRFKRAVKDLKGIADLDDETPWAEARSTLAHRTNKELGVGQ